MSRLSQSLSAMPPSTMFFIGLCVATYAFQLVDDPPLTHYTLCPRNVFYLHEYYRIVTSTFFHGGLMHLGMNVMSTSAIGTMLERRYGTMKHLLTVLWGILLTSFVYCAVAWVCSTLFGYDGLMYQHSVGFSGVLFQLSVLEANLNPHGTRNVFGFFQVSSKMYPWALLVIIQVVMPHISFMGHLSGILVGTLQLYGVLDSWCFPPEEYLRMLDNHERLRFLTGRPTFVPTPASVEDGGTSGTHDRSLRVAAIHCATKVWTVVRNVTETIRAIIFGYDNRRTTPPGGSADSAAAGRADDDGNDGWDDGAVEEDGEDDMDVEMQRLIEEQIGAGAGSGNRPSPGRHVPPGVEDSRNV